MTIIQDTPTSYDLSAEEQHLIAEVKDFADNVVAPAAYEYDTKRELPYGIIAQMGEMGLFGLPFPREYGGRGKTYFQFCLAIEQLSREEIEAKLRNGFEIEDTASILDAILGPED